jgi:hypothetical protein
VNLGDVGGILAWNGDGRSAAFRYREEEDAEIAVDPQQARGSDPKLQRGQHGQSEQPARTDDPLQHINVQAQKKLAALTRTATVVARCQSQAEEHPPCRGARSRERAGTGSLAIRCDSGERSVGAKLPRSVG